MPVIDNKLPSKVVLGYDKGTFSYSKLTYNASNAQIYSVAQALNSVQEDPMIKVRRIDVKKLLME